MPTLWFRQTVVLFPLLAILQAVPAAQDRVEHNLQRSKLTASQDVEGVPCGPGYLWRFDDGRLHRCTIDRDAVVRNAWLPKGATVAFTPEGGHAFVFLPKTTTVKGYACRGSGHGFMTQFFDSGELKLCWMPDDLVIQGVPCAGFSVWSDVVRASPSGVYFHENGALASCRLSRAVTVDGVALKKNQRIELDARGRAAGAVVR